MDQQSHTHSVKQNYSQRRSGDAVNPRNIRRDFSEDEEYDDVWPSRMPTSTRRYQGDVKTETGRAGADVQMSSHGGYRTSSNLGRTGGNMIPPRRTATQNMPAIPQTRRPATQNIPAAQPVRRTVTQNIPAVHPTTRRPLDDFEEDIPQRTTTLLKQPKSSGRRFHWLVYVGLALIGMLICWIVLTTFLSWWQVTQDDLHYGRPRTAQYDYVVGHGDSNANKSHFIALNLRRHIEVIECPAGDCSRARVLIGPVLIGPNQDLAPVTLTFKDVNGDGKPDIIVNVQDSHFMFINDHGTFRPTRTNDNIHL